MKTIYFKTFIITFLVFFIGIACEKENVDYDSNSIIGEWKWLYSVTGDLTSVEIYPEDRQVLTMEFGINGNLVFRENGNIYKEKVYSIFGETLSYVDNIEFFYLFKIKGDTLNLTNLHTLGDFSYFRRIR